MFTFSLFGRVQVANMQKVDMRGWVNDKRWIVSLRPVDMSRTCVGPSPRKDIEENGPTCLGNVGEDIRRGIVEKG